MLRGFKMAILNLLKASFTGKVGQMVGAKWKNKNTLRAYTKPADSNTPAQQTIRAAFGEMESFLALFTDQIKSVSALDVKGMSVRNAITKLNKAQMPTGEFDPTTLKLSRGGLPAPTAVSITVPAARDKVVAEWTAAVGASITEKAKVVVVVVNKPSNFAVVGTALNTAGTLEVPATVPAGAALHAYVYLIDYRGSTRVGSQSSYFPVTAPEKQDNG
jgi:hypothetical protein